MKKHENGEQSSSAGTGNLGASVAYRPASPFAPGITKDALMTPKTTSHTR